MSTLKKDAMPLYSRIATIIEKKIYTGRYEPGSRLPNEDELAESFGVSKITIKSALNHLVAAELITRVRGRGSFVADAVPDIKSHVYTSMNSIVEAYSGTSRQVFDIGIIKAGDSRSPKDLNEFFGMDKQDDVGRVISTRIGSISHFVESYLLPEYSKLITKKELETEGFVLSILQKKACLTIPKGSMKFQADIAEPDISDVLQCQSFEPVIHIQAYFWSEPERPLLVENVYYPARYFQYQVDMDMGIC
jgi:DNA-binding GntR family transcriptional regulator